jgi:hypothetical protein
MKTSDDRLNQLLSGVKPVPPNVGLAQRIIAQSSIEASTPSNIQASAKHQGVNKDGLFKQVLHTFIFPKPAYALACSMLVGILLGWQNSDMTELDTGFGLDGEIESALQITSIEEDLSSLFLAEVNYYE